LTLDWRRLDKNFGCSIIKKKKREKERKELRIRGERR